MKKSETKDRIKEALEIREMKQAELVEKTGIDKGQMSSYISGKYKPRQNNLHLIAEALSVDEAWLMGYDVPMERINYEEQYDGRLNEEQQHLNFFEKRLLKSFLKLTDENKKRSINYTENLLVLQNMDTEQSVLLNAAHDNGATKEQKINADNIMMDDSEWE